MNMQQKISYAINAEDIVLDRLFANQSYGRYIDIGASFPTLGSITKIFYGRGWRGINVEPSPIEFEQLMNERGDDVNLTVAVSDFVGTAEFFVGTPEQFGLGTLDPTIANRSLGAEATPIQVSVTTLARIVDEFVAGPVDFLNINVGGLEHAVIAGTNWENFHPRVVVVEAMAPWSTVPTHESWEPLLLRAHYVCALFDGLNRFYAKDDDSEALALLGAPANVLDRYVSYDLWSIKENYEKLSVHNAEIEKHNQQLQHRINMLSVAQKLRDH